MKKLVIIPTYKEKENIVSIIKAVLEEELRTDLLVVDDNSPDGTADLVKSLLGEYEGRLFLHERPGKQGLGTAYIYGFHWAIERDYDFIFEMDADFSHNPKDLNRLLQACEEGADVAVGSRYVKGGKTENWPWDRNLLSHGASWYVRILTWLPVRDPTAGFVCYKRQVLQAIDLNAIHFIGYAFQIEMKFTAWKLGFKIKEIPITFVDRQLGASKLTKNIVREGILGVIQMQWQALWGRIKKKPKH